MKDPYTYENSNILINKFNIKDASLLEKAEADFVALGANKLINEGFEANKYNYSNHTIENKNTKINSLF